MQLHSTNIEIIWQRLISVADQMSTNLARTAFSTVITASNDYGCIIMDQDGNCIVHAERSLPIFNRTLPYCTKLIIERFKDSIFEGDIFISNNPWENAGHNPDISIITPIFKDSKLIGFTASVAHHADIGGSININQVSDCYEEGLMIPLLKIYEKNKVNSTLINLIKANVRLPEIIVGDINAQISANKTGYKQCLNILSEYKLGNFESISKEIFKRSDIAMRKAITKLPNGNYKSSVIVDELDNPLTINCKLKVSNDSILIDFDGTTVQQPRGGINVTKTFTFGQVSYALKAILIPDVPGNDGCYKSISVSAPLGCVLNAKFPASVSQRHRVGAHIFGTILKSLYQIIPENVISGSGFLVTSLVTAKSKDNDKYFHAYMFSAGGMGANNYSNGISTVQVPALAGNVPVELFELKVPILTTKREFIKDSCGNGKYRGGLAQKVEFKLLPNFNGEATISIFAAGQNIKPFGLDGAHGGKTAEIIKNDIVLTKNEKLNEASSLSLADHYSSVGFETAGGGGYGNPKDRILENVLSDYKNDYISLKNAKTIYGKKIKSEDKYNFS